MKPHVICHMLTSIDGRILSSRWSPEGYKAGDLFEKLHDQLGCDAWIIGRVTGSEFAKGKSYPSTTSETLPRENHFASREAKSYGVALDAQGKIVWGRQDIGGDPVVVVLTRQVSDAHLAGLCADGVSYIFAGDTEIDLAQVLDILDRELGVKQVLLEGGGGANGAFLRAGLVDEISVVICPAVDGSKGAPSLFDSSEADAGVKPPLRSVKLQSSKVLEGGAVWLRYLLENN